MILWNRCLLVVSTTLLLWSCGISDTVLDDGDVPGDDTALPDLSEDGLDSTPILPPGHDIPETYADMPEFIGGEGLQDIALEPQPGEPGFSCQTGADCYSGFCIETAEGRQCTITCQDECPFGWECLPHQPSLPDEVYICAPILLDLCRPCTTNDECRLNGVNAGQVCVDYGPAGLFCGEACTETTDCPWGYVCQEVTDVTGANSSQCVLQDGECECAQRDVDAGAWTECYRENEWGTCTGTRSCVAAGLEPCSALEPAKETCNGEDDNCDEQIDEDTDGDDCLVQNQFGSCPGTDKCTDGELLCEGPEASPEMCDGKDNDCDGQTDEDFEDTDGDGTADCMEEDKDGDGVVNGLDNCPAAFNPQQEDHDFDNDGDACDADDDNDQIPDNLDCAPFDKEVNPEAEEVCDGKDNNCNYIVDEGWTDTDGDGWKDCVDEDDDNDLSPDSVDCAPLDPLSKPSAAEICDGKDNDCDGETDEGFEDTDGDGEPDCLDEDSDEDGIDNADDNCPLIANDDQQDADQDGMGDVCDIDMDGDSIPNAPDNCPTVFNVLQGDIDEDGDGDKCDEDIDGDGAQNDEDNCPLVANAEQADFDEDGIGDACEDDTDGDGVDNAQDCKPNDPAIHPGAEEQCDGADNDCNGLIDEGYPDFDGDDIKNCIDDDDDDDGDPDDSDCASLEPAVHHLATEECDGVDNDCDGEIDEELGTVTCGKGACTHTVAVCENGAPTNCDPYEQAAIESCDGIDNDCDGLVDEDLGFAICGLGACMHTGPNCENGQEVICDPQEGAQAEVCDGLDNDCDGKTDEELGQKACGKGQCYHTVKACVGGEEQQCDPFAGAQKEVCDGADNDCNGETDEGLGTSTCGLGECEHTVDKCVDGAQQICNPLEGAQPEACDGLDNDCNGLLDDGMGQVSCGLGECLNTVPACMDGQPQECNPLDGAEPETCDGLDNDCDGTADEELGVLTCGLGECIHSVQPCIDGQSQECDPLEGAIDEICDGLDNDCDGSIDNGFSDVDMDGEADCVDTEDDGDGILDDDDNCPLVSNPGQEDLDTDELGDLCDPDADGDDVPAEEGDCDDLDPQRYPGNPELLDGVDNDCNELVDDGVYHVNCHSILAMYPESESGTFTIDPDGDGAVEPFEVYCNMEEGATFYHVANGKSTCGKNDDDSCNDVGLMLFSPASPWHIEAAAAYVHGVLEVGCGNLGPLGVYSTRNGDTGCGDWHSCCVSRDLHSDEYGDDTLEGHGCDWTSLAGTRWYVCDDCDNGEPNGDYAANTWLEAAAWGYDSNCMPNNYNDNNSGYCYTSYVCMAPADVIM